MILGASFDEPAANAAFRNQQGFPYRLLSDTDRTVATRYGTVSDADDPRTDYPRRRTILIDPNGIVCCIYDVQDVATHPDEVLADLRALATAT